jgi:hypothetical protein
MTTHTVLLALSAAALLSSPADPVAPVSADEEAIERAARDYVEGFYAGDLERLERGVHPSLQKLIVRRMPWAEELQRMDRETLLEHARMSAAKEAGEERRIEVAVLGVYQNTAVARIASPDFVDHAQLVRINGDWRVVNVLWAEEDPRVRGSEPGEEDLAAIEEAGLDYVDGFYAGSTERLSSALHPRLQKVMVQRLSNGREVLRFTSTDGLLLYAESGSSRKPEAERDVEVAVLEVYGNVATIEILSADFMDYAHVARLNGEWKIVNVAWAPRSRTG